MGWTGNSTANWEMGWEMGYFKTIPGMGWEMGRVKMGEHWCQIAFVFHIRVCVQGANAFSLVISVHSVVT